MDKQDQRFKMARFAMIDEILRTVRFPTRDRIIDEVRGKGFDTSRATFQRDLAEMRKDGAPIIVKRTKSAETDGDRFDYYTYGVPDYKYEVDGIDPADLQAILLARELLDHYKGVPVAEELKKTYERLLGFSDAFVHQELIGNNVSPVSFSLSPQPPIKPDVWKTCLEAIRNHETLLLHYKKGWNANKKDEPRRVDPYRILNLNGVWYLLATASLKDDDLRQYNMARIESVKPAGVHFTVPESLQREIEVRIENAFGSFLGDSKNLVEVTVEFSTRVRPLIKGRIFHVRERRRDLPGGRTRISFPASSAGPWPFYHIVSWILSWGRDAKAISPPKLVALVQNEIVLMAATDTRDKQLTERE